jgi:glycerophosphoryl diester phosphodiesterase
MVRIIAHRGASRACPENSLAAFRRALSSGADSLEVDLRSSVDGVIYCLHDYHLRRLTGFSGYVKSTHSRQIDRLRLMDIEPTLRFEHFLEEFAGKAEIVLDIKSAGIETDILRLLSRTPKRAEIVFSSFNSRVLSRLKNLQPNLRTALILGPLRNLKVNLDISSYIVSRLRKLNCEAAHLSVRIARERVVRKLRAAGFAVAVWTVDDCDSAAKLVGYGVSGIITNMPEEIVKIRNRLEATRRTDTR